tara:strand:+ start:2815 stop:2934 length:120 start_codon:yes stop_codon:yes gene_type:complete
MNIIDIEFYTFEEAVIKAVIFSDIIGGVAYKVGGGGDFF